MAARTLPQPRTAECLFCGSTDHEFCFQGRDRWFTVDGLYNVHRCRCCGLLFLNPQPSPQQIALHYPRGYYAFDGERPEEARKEHLYAMAHGEHSSPVKKLLSLPYRPVLRTIPARRGDRILDVGCGSGHFLKIARKVFSVDAYGVEPYSYDAAYAARYNLNIFHGALDQAAFPDQFFDAVTLNHVFEHMEDPRSTLREVRRIVKPGGRVVIGLPQSRCLLFWLFGRRWWQLDVPRHLFVPSVHNLSMLAEKTGFSITAVRYNSTPSSIMATLYYWRSDLFRKHRTFEEFEPSRLSFIALLPIAYLLNFLRIGDQVELVMTTR